MAKRKSTKTEKEKAEKNKKKTSTKDKSAKKSSSSKSTQKKVASKKSSAKSKTTSKKSTAKPKSASKKSSAKPKTDSKKSAAKSKTTSKKSPAKSKAASKKSATKSKNTSKKSAAKSKNTSKKSSAKSKATSTKSAAKPKSASTKSTTKSKANSKKSTAKSKTDSKKSTAKSKTDSKKSAAKSKTTSKKSSAKPKSASKKSSAKSKATSTKSSAKSKANSKDSENGKLEKKPKKKMSWISKFFLTVLTFLIAYFGFVQIRAYYKLNSRITIENYETAYFSGGCFWCVEADFEKIDGVYNAVSGFMGGYLKNPTYPNHGDHRETVEVRYNPSQVSYENLVEYFFRHHDPTDEGGSFYDRGFAYTSAIYPQNRSELEIAYEVIEELEEKEVFEDEIVTAVELGNSFWPVEEYHQDYYIKNPARYNGYRLASGRDKFIDSVWGDRDDFEVSFSSEPNAWSKFEKPSEDDLREELSEISFRVTQEDKTEKPFSEGNYDSNYEDGIYVDIVSGEPLFSSRDKYDSGTGWPSFTRPISMEFIVIEDDFSLLVPRKEVRSRYADSHLGHVFKDGPEPRGERWCMNGASLMFIPYDEMEELGYEDYLGYVK